MEEQEGTELDLRALQEERFKLTDLRDHAGYRYLMQIAKAQMNARHQAVFLTPLKKLDDTLEQEYHKGEMAGIALFMNMVDVRVDELTNAINQELIKENGDGERDGSTSDFDDNDTEFTDGAP